MTDIERIRRKIERLYEGFEEPKVNVPLALQVRQWISFAKEYIGAASILEKEAPQYWLPVLQMTGQAVESSLKACLAAANTDPPNHHDLIQLYTRAAELGFELDDSDLAAIVHLRHFYFHDLSTNTKFKTRYPTKQDERLGGTVPSNSTFVSIVHSLIEQAADRSKLNTAR